MLDILHPAHVEFTALTLTPAVMTYLAYAVSKLRQTDKLMYIIPGRTLFVLLQSDCTN